MVVFKFPLSFEAVTVDGFLLSAEASGQAKHPAGIIIYNRQQVRTHPTCSLRFI